MLSLLALSSTLCLPACDNGDGDDDGDSGDGACAGPITECRLAELSEEQQATYCDTLLATIDDEPGTQYTCESSGTFLAVSTTMSPPRRKGRPAAHPITAPMPFLTGYLDWVEQGAP